VGLFLAATALHASPKTLIDYFLPILVTKHLTANAWGAGGVLPRDQDNGIEDKTNKSHTYWGGRILRAADGKHHL